METAISFSGDTYLWKTCRAYHTADRRRLLLEEAEDHGSTLFELKVSRERSDRVNECVIVPGDGLEHIVLHLDASSHDHGVYLTLAMEPGLALESLEWRRQKNCTNDGGSKSWVICFGLQCFVVYLKYKS